MFMLAMLSPCYLKRGISDNGFSFTVKYPLSSPPFSCMIDEEQSTTACFVSSEVTVVFAIVIK